MKKPLAIVTGVTEDHAFAAGAMLLLLDRHVRGTPYEAVVLTTGLGFNDRRLLERLPQARIERIEHVEGVGRSGTEGVSGLCPEALARFSAIALAKLELFSLLEEYDTVVWLDADVAVQGDFMAELAGYGPLPLAMAHEDPHFREEGPQTMAANFTTPPPGCDCAAPLYNSGVIVAQAALPEPAAVRAELLAALGELGETLRFPDQGLLNLLALRRPTLVRTLPCARFNCHPMNPESLRAPLVHAFGAFKFWNDGALALLFPEWTRAYEAWTAQGGAPYRGRMVNREWVKHGAYHTLARLMAAVKTQRERNAALETALRERDAR